jgi:hypothetical protein
MSRDKKVNNAVTYSWFAKRKYKPILDKILTGDLKNINTMISNVFFITTKQAK